MMDGIALSLATAGLSVYVYVMTRFFREFVPQRRLPDKHLWGATSVGFSLELLSAVLYRDPMAYVFAIGDAFALCMWIRSGGGKGPRKRFRLWLNKFKPVRRAAPVMGRP